MNRHALQKRARGRLAFVFFLLFALPMISQLLRAIYDTCTKQYAQAAIYRVVQYVWRETRRATEGLSVAA